MASPEISPTLIMQGIEGMMLADTFAKNSTEHQEISNPFRLWEEARWQERRERERERERNRDLA
jgi:hypothetical protein